MGTCIIRNVYCAEAVLIYAQVVSSDTLYKNARQLHLSTGSLHQELMGEKDEWQRDSSIYHTPSMLSLLSGFRAHYNILLFL